MRTVYNRAATRRILEMKKVNAVALKNSLYSLSIIHSFGYTFVQ
jgi:hypothetical protein